MNDIKSRKQREFADKYIELFNDYYSIAEPCNFSIISATGTGKSMITFLILDEIHKYFDKIIILVNADRLRDFTWKEEFKKWNRQDILAKTELVNYQTAYKWTQDKVDLSKTFLVLDEIDFIIGTDNYGRLFQNYPDVSMLGLTGYCAISKREELNRVCRPIVEYTFEQAVADGVINDVKFVFVKFDLDKEKSIKVEYTDKITKQRKSFYQSENDAYDYADAAFRIAYGKWDKANSDYTLGMCTAKELSNLEYDMKRKRDARLKILYNGIASKKIALGLQESILKESNNKVITFSRYTAQCDNINSYTYHSKNTDIQNDSNLSNFNEGKIRSLGVCSKIDRGENLKGLNNIILESYTSSDTIITQRRGRSSRLGVNEVATFYVLLPYFMRKNKDKSYTLAETQAVTWAKNMLAQEDTSDCKVIDLRTIKE
jgi:superfamily II DNA or RNA helicase